MSNYHKTPYGYVRTGYNHPNQHRLPTHREQFRRMFSNFLTFPPQFILFFAVFALVVVSSIGFIAYSYIVVETHQNCTVTSKDRTTDNNGASNSRVYTDNCGVLKVDDMFFIGQFNSADIYGSIQEGETYDFETRGVRLPIISSFPNITKVTPSPSR